MTESFNPYLKWLGISLADQPPNHYRLLGIPDLIDDPDVIDNAANRQMGHVRTFATGKYSQLSQKLLNEIAAAKVCLLTPAKKQAYDEQLRQASARKAAQSAPAPAAATVVPVLHTRALPQATALPTSESAPNFAAAESHSVTQRVKKKNSPGMLAAVALGLLALVGIAIWRLSSSSPEEAVVAEQDPIVQNPVDVPTVPPVVEDDEDETPDGPPAISKVDPPAKTPEVKTPLPTETTPAQSAPAQEDEDSANPTSIATGQTVDVLQQIDLKRDAVVGSWKLDDGAIVSPAENEHSRMMLPTVVPKEYVLEMDVERIAGDNMLFVGLLVGGKQIELLLDYHPPNQRVHISGVNPNGIAPYYHEPVFESGRPSRIRCEVTAGQVKASVNGKTIVDLRERLNELNMPDSWAIPKRDVLFLGSHHSGYRFTKIELTPIDAGNEAIAKTDATKSNSKPVDLLKEIDLTRDSVGGAWTLDGKTLVSPEAANQARIMLPGKVPQEYLLDMEVERIEGDNMLFVALMVAGKQRELFFDLHEGGEDPYSGFVPIPNYPVHRSPVFQNRRSVRIACRVTAERVEVSVDNKTILDVLERLNEMSMADAWPIANREVLYLGSWRTQFRFTKIELTPLDGSQIVPPTQPGQPAANENLPVAKKQPLPAGAELETAQSTLREIFQEEITAAKTSEQQSTLAKTFLGQITGDKQSAAESFVLLNAAKAMAIKAADSETAMTAVDKLAERFEIDALDLKAKTLTDLAKPAKTPDEQMALILAIGPVVRELVEVDRFDEAEPLTKLAQSAALKTRDIQLKKDLAVSVKEFGELQKAYRSVQPALKKLKQSPDDAAANLEVGRYLAFSKKDWLAGLKNLAAGSDETLRDLAAKDLTGANDAAARVKLGDAWWDAAKAETGDTQKGFKIRAGHWYSMAISDLTGLSREQVARRLEEIRELSPGGAILPQDWKIWAWDGNGYQDSQFGNLRFEQGMLSLARVPGQTSQILLVYKPFLANKPFFAKFEIKGEVEQIGLASAEGLQKAIVAYGIRDQNWHTATIERTANKQIKITIDGKNIEVRTWNTDNNMDGLIAFFLTHEDSFSLRNFEVQTTGSK